MMRRAIRARVPPSAAISASCVGRTLMIANSAATKNPFAMMNSRASSRYQVGILTEREEPPRYQMGRCPWGGRYCMTTCPAILDHRRGGMRQIRFHQEAGHPQFLVDS